MTTMRRVWATLGVGALLVGASPAFAQQSKDFGGQALKMVLEHLHEANCGEVKCAPATAAEKANPPIAPADAQQIAGRGMLSAYAMHCGLDWQKRNFDPMMAYWRTQKTRPVRELTMIAGIHGVSQGAFLKMAQGQGACTAQLKAEIDTKLDFKPPAAP